MRLKDMDEAGIDMQVLSWSGGGEDLVSQDGIIYARKHNDKLAEIINKYPERFAGFSMIPWQETSAAVAELERAVKELGLRGIKRNGVIKGEYLSGKKYWPVFKKAEELGIPIFIHIGGASLEATKGGQYPVGLGLAMAMETDLTNYAAYLIGSGLFDECPKLQIILGHMGEGLPFWAGRLDQRAAELFELRRKPSECINENFFVATSGKFYHPALLCCYLATGADRILFAVDYPPDPNKEAVEFIERADISPSDKEKIYHLNAERLFGI
jgi:predicted TIM-barrel fold metal-dependent hydrolase